ncbi:hypothetical protein E2C01_014012 [Portunus trituberculatus]|uniref:Uncharacterized protein n=1 Tax=Portunus trituberculatus TaxID=210409 RepID=A0A5B7DJ02_PORTR|nr:hypothetical protein [Portunus trituberculatus]
MCLVKDSETQACIFKRLGSQRDPTGALHSIRMCVLLVKEIYVTESRIRFEWRECDVGEYQEAVVLTNNKVQPATHTCSPLTRQAAAALRPSPTPPRPAAAHSAPFRPAR